MLKTIENPLKSPLKLLLKEDFSFSCRRFSTFDFLQRHSPLSVDFSIGATPCSLFSTAPFPIWKTHFTAPSPIFARFSSQNEIFRGDMWISTPFPHFTNG